MKNKTLIAYLQQFDDDMEVWLLDRYKLDEYIPEEPKVHFDYHPAENMEFICIQFGHAHNGN